MIRSEHVAFKALPGVCTRLFDIQFGLSGLSIRHFARLSQSDRIHWLESGGSNFDNLSATAEFGRAIPASHIDDVIDSVRVFLMYAREYCCLELVELVENIVAFIEQTLKQVSWSSDDLSVLVYWVNDLLEDFRAAAEVGSGLSQVTRRCSTDDRQLRDLMFVKVHRQVESMSVGASVVAAVHSEEHSKPAHHEQKHRTTDDKRRLSRIPRNVLNQLPVQVVPGSGKPRSLCMRFLSKVGCNVTQDGSCPHNRGHFVPNKLPNDVKSTIIQRFGVCAASRRVTGHDSEPIHVAEPACFVAKGPLGANTADIETTSKVGATHPSKEVHRDRSLSSDENVEGGRGGESFRRRLKPCSQPQSYAKSKFDVGTCSICFQQEQHIGEKPVFSTTLAGQDTGSRRSRPCVHSVPPASTTLRVAAHINEKGSIVRRQLGNEQVSRTRPVRVSSTSSSTVIGGLDPTDSAKELISLSKVTAETIRSKLEEELLRQECKITLSQRKKGFLRSPKSPNSQFEVDKLECTTLSRIIRSQNWSLKAATQFLRGEDEGDPRPNKALDPDRLRLVLQGYPHLDLLIRIAERGLEAQWIPGPSRRGPPPKNHGSCQYMVVEASILDRWPEVVCSPLGTVEKKDSNPADEVRTIHDLSFPRDASVNSSFVAESVPRLRYQSIVAIARRIEYLAHRGHAGNIRILKGDAKGAFRHLMTAAAQVFRMAAYIEELGILIIDLAAPFGWSGSPPYYSLFGRAITWRMGTNSPASVSNSNDSERFFPYEWVDDHILVEPDVGDRLQVAEATLRHAMLAVLGPRSINEAKFSSWSSDLTALGLRWNTVDRSVSIPADKIEKAHSRVRAMLEKGAASKSEFYKLLGSLRHVATCLRTAKPFYQRLQCQCTSAPRFGKVKLSEGSVADLLWFEQILNHGCLAELPLDMFGDTFSPHVELYMNASNIGAAVLDPASDEFIQVKFDNDELRMINIPQATGPEFSINVREHLCIALAVWTWGPKWSRQSKGRMLYIKCWSDNTSAVVWCNKLRSGNVFSQELNRCIGLAEAYFNLRVSAAHIPGSINSMADAASRAWTEPYHSRWTNFSSCWKQAQVPVTCRKLYTGFSSNFSPARWPRHQHQNTAEHGRSGAHGVSGLISHDGCPRALDNTHTNSPYLPCTAGNLAGTTHEVEILPVPCSQKSVISRGIIARCLDTASNFSQAINFQLQECADQIHPVPQNPRSQQPSSSDFMSISTSHQSNTESYGELRCWASSFF